MARLYAALEKRARSGSTNPELSEAEKMQRQSLNALNLEADSTVWLVSKGCGKGRWVREVLACRGTPADYTERSLLPAAFQSDHAMGGWSEGEAETASENGAPASSSQANARTTHCKRQVQKHQFLSCMTCWPFHRCCVARSSRADS